MGVDQRGRYPRRLPLEKGQEIGDALHVVVGDHLLPLGTPAALVGLGVRQRVHPRQGEHRLQATVGAEHDVSVQAVAHHHAAAAVQAALRRHAVHHEAVGLAHLLRLPLGRHLHRGHQAARTWEGETAMLWSFL